MELKWLKLAVYCKSINFFKDFQLSVRLQGSHANYKGHGIYVVYQIHTPLKFYNLELTVNPPSQDYKCFKQFWLMIRVYDVAFNEMDRLAGILQKSTYACPPIQEVVTLTGTESQRPGSTFPSWSGPDFQSPAATVFAGLS